MQGIIVTADEIEAAVAKALRESDVQIKRYQILGQILGLLRKDLKWANQAMVKTELDAQMLKLLGPKDERDDLKKIVI
jgi:glutaminyl-tRNA synthetase